ncbi:unnamed protein product [Symbiodinium sp. CCMP2592]|nr:unnamed protein product [Symbiodinium sp. CCMP2592]
MATRTGFALSAIVGRMALGLKINEVLNEVQSDLQQGLALQADLLLRWHNWMLLTRLLALSWLGRQLANVVLAGADENDEKLDTAESCWVEDPLGSKSNWAKHCCRPKPCGQSECWVPPMYTYEFCCDEDACRNLAVEEVKHALDLTVESLPNENASSLAFRAAPQAFRKMRGLQAELATADQACTCGIAFAVATLLWYPEDSAALDIAIKPRWFLEGMDWGRFVEEGWSSIFKWLDRFAQVEGQVCLGMACCSVALFRHSWTPW